jgi:hypothetical protein
VQPDLSGQFPKQFDHLQRTQQTPPAGKFAIAAQVSHSQKALQSHPTNGRIHNFTMNYTYRFKIFFKYKWAIAHHWQSE